MKQVISLLLLNECITLNDMLSFKQLFLLIQLHGLMCRENEDFRRISSSINPFILFVSVSIDDHFVVINCSTPDRVPHHKLDWYFQTQTSLKPPRVIWQRGRSNVARYIAYSPDQFRHFLQIQPIHSNDSGTYMCLDQTTGFYDRIELIVLDHRTSVAHPIDRSIRRWILLMVVFSLISRHRE